MIPNDPTTQFSWTNNQTLTGMAASGTGIPTSFTAASNASLANITGTVVVTPTLGVCVGQPASYTVTIYPTPVVNPVANIVKCPNQPVGNITLSVMPAGGTPSFAWSNSNQSIGLAGSGTVTPIPGFTTVNNGTTQQVANISVGASLNGCPAVPVPFTITVNPNPIANFSANNKICIGSPMSFSDASTVGSGFINQWSWSLDGGPAFATIQNPVYAIPASGPHSITLTSTTDQGCVNVVTHTVYINPLPVAMFTGGGQGCPLLTINNFRDTSMVPDGTHVHSWSWNFGNGATYSATAPTTPNPSGNLTYGNSSPMLNATYTVSLVVVSDSGCVSTAYSKPCVTVWPHPLPGFSFGPIDPAADIDNPIVYIFDESQGASGPNGLLWYLGDVFASNPQSNYTSVQNPVHAYEHYDPYTYYVTQWVSNVYGCKDSLTKPIEILPNWTFYIPNAFSPNGDGVNEGFKGTGVGIDTTTYNLWIFDRWGMQIFYSDDMEKVWDGHIQGKTGDIVQEDVYVWKVKFHDFLGKKHEYKGTVSVIK
jgi:gliding motility-associated-like protein